MKRKRVSERGSALVEMAVILPILVLLIHGIFYFGRGYVNKEKVEMAARFAAWEKIARPGDTVEMVKDAITEKYFRGETIQLRYISDQEECRNAARAAAGGSAGTGRRSMRPSEFSRALAGFSARRSSTRTTPRLGAFRRTSFRPGPSPSFLRSR